MSGSELHVFTERRTENAKRRTTNVLLLAPATTRRDAYKTDAPRASTAAANAPLSRSELRATLFYTLLAGR